MMTEANGCSNGVLSGGASSSTMMPPTSSSFLSSNFTNSLLFKPVPLAAMFNQSSSSAAHSHILTQFVAVAGSDISQDAQVFLLYDMPIHLLARRFAHAETTHDKLKIMVSVSVKSFYYSKIILRVASNDSI